MVPSECSRAASLLYDLFTCQRVSGTHLNSASVPSGHGVYAEILLFTHYLRYSSSCAGWAQVLS